MRIIAKLKIVVALSLLYVLLFSSLGWAKETRSIQYANPSPSLTASQVKRIEQYIRKQKRKSKIPGLAVVIVKGDRTVYQKCFGYANLDKKRRVTLNTLFELGSTSKAFTGLGILKLQSEGKLNLNDSVGKYLPWFKMKYKGKTITGITIEQLLHHTSGIQYKTIGYIPSGTGDNALTDTVRTLVGQDLENKPGDRYLYASINYDVLGLIIQKITGQSYETYMKNNVLKPLGLKNTFLFYRDKLGREMATGYRLGFLRPVEFDAPVYRGNTPAGYYMTNAKDVARWLKIQLGTVTTPFNPGVIELSHLPNRTVPPQTDGSSYAAGWMVYQMGGGQWGHFGLNPNFSSLIGFLPTDKIGVAVLANMNSQYTESIGRAIIHMLIGRKLLKPFEDYNTSLDNIYSIIFIISTVVLLFTVGLLSIVTVEIIQSKRKFVRKSKRALTKLGFSFLLLLLFGYCLYQVAYVVYGEVPWEAVAVWGPLSLVLGVISLFVAGLLFYVYLIMTIFFPKENDKSLFTLIILSLSSGFGNAFIIFVINEALNRSDSYYSRGIDQRFDDGLFVYFLLGMVIYVYGQKVIRKTLINITNNLVFLKRTELISRILKTSYQQMETIENGKIPAALNNDTETISSFANVVLTGGTSFVTLICCFLFLGTINFYALLISILVTLVAAGFYFMVGRSANVLWEQTRDIQNHFFKFINDLTSGFKELNLHRNKRQEFQKDMVESCKTYSIKRIQGELQFANVFVVGELVFTIVIGVVAFIFPLIFQDIQTSSLRSYIFVFLYMTGPVRSILDTVPRLIQVRISWNRLNELVEQLAALNSSERECDDLAIPISTVHIRLHDVQYQYQNEYHETFTVGPINCEFGSGEITFITGGNGSGKSTLAKLITGLYPPDQGEIFINGERMLPGDLGKHYAAIFSDFYLFSKLYGVDYHDKQTEILLLLKKLFIDDKLQVEEGRFSTLNLSSGQRKRLAFLVACLEDRPVYLFDEWAADQDPEFRKYFYHVLLPELKARGKCVIAITHDERYFNTADRVIKMEMGKIMAQESNVIPTSSETSIA